MKKPSFRYELSCQFSVARDLICDEDSQTVTKYMYAENVNITVILFVELRENSCEFDIGIQSPGQD